MSAGGSATGGDPAAIRRAARRMFSTGLFELAGAVVYYLLTRRPAISIAVALTGVVLLVYGDILRRRAR